MITEPFFRRNLPHWQPAGATFFITYRLAGTLPVIVLNELQKEHQRLQALPREPSYSEAEWNLLVAKKMFACWDKRLDQDRSIKWLPEPRISSIIRDNIYHHAGTKYSLWAYVIMPNHVHVVLQPSEVWTKRFEQDDGRKAQYEKGSLSAILHSLRGYTAREANKILCRTGKFWQGAAYDHWVRDNDELQRIIRYVEKNPVQAGLVESPEDWRFSSAYDRIQQDLGPFDMIV
ncbi:transposase [Candidatus Poribacteria bacterium]